MNQSDERNKNSANLTDADQSQAMRLWNHKVRTLTPYVPGEQPKNQLLIKLNTNENPYPPPEQVKQALRDYPMERLRLYPDPSSGALRETIAAYHGLETKQVFVGNGSDEVLAFAFQAFFEHDGPAVLFPDITYSFYPVYARMFDLCWHTPHLDESFHIRLQDYLVKGNPVVLANPNAPTGIALELDEIEQIVQADTDRLVLVDEAYVDFGAQSAAALLDRYDNLLVVQTFSKSRSLAGLRVGFALGSTGLIEALERIRDSINSYTLDSLAQAAAKAALESGAWFEQTRQRLIETREQCADRLHKLGFMVLPSRANFLFVHHPDHEAAWIYGQLRAVGILVRHFTAERIDSFLRISIGTEDDMSVLCSRLEAILASQSKDSP